MLFLLGSTGFSSMPASAGLSVSALTTDSSTDSAMVMANC